MRQPITLKIKFKSASLDQFIERYSVDVSKGGIFIRTKEPLAVGTSLKFEFQLQDSSALIAGEGTVVWTREHDPSRAGVAPGMGVRFDKLAATSQTVLDQILAEKTRRGEAQVESRFDAGIRASSSSAVAPRRDFDATDSRAHTPLPKPSPGFDGAEEEFGQESTRVMQDEVVQRLAESTRGQQRAKEAFSDEPTRARSPEEIDQLVRASGSESMPAAEAAARQAPVLSSVAPPPPPATKPPAKPVAKPSVPPAIASSPSVPSIPSIPVVASSPSIDSKPATFEPEADEVTTVAAPSLPIAAPIESAFQDERPPQPRKSGSSALPAVLGVGIIGALAVGYFIYTQKPATTTPPPEPEITKAPEPAKPAEATAPPTETPTPSTPTAPKGPSVAVTSEPPGASVTVDGTAQAAPTPTTLEGLDPKKSYDVVVSLKGFQDWKTKLTPKDGAKLDAKLVENEKVVEVSSTPGGADVILDGKKLGRTPYTIHKLDVSKEHSVELRHAGFEPQTRAVSAGDSWEAKDGKDVLPIALTLAALPPKAHAAVKHATKPEAKPADGTAEPSKPDETKPDDKPAAETKPAAPVEKPVADKPEAKKPAKPADEDKAIKTPDFMKGNGEGGEAQ